MHRASIVVDQESLQPHSIRCALYAPPYLPDQTCHIQETQTLLAKHCAHAQSRVLSPCADRTTRGPNNECIAQSKQLTMNFSCPPPTHITTRARFEKPEPLRREGAPQPSRRPPQTKKQKQNKAKTCDFRGGRPDLFPESKTSNPCAKPATNHERPC